LLKGLEISEVMLSSVPKDDDRLDAEYYSQQDIHIEEQLHLSGKIKPLSSFGEIVASAFYPAATQLYQYGDTPFIRCVDCIYYPVVTKRQESMFEKIPKAFGVNNKGIASINKGDIIITKVGSPCFASILADYDEVMLSRTVLGIKNIRGIDAYYLMIFLRSKYGFKQLLRQRELTIQYQLTLGRVKSIYVFHASRDFQKIIKKTVEKYIQLSEQSHALYAEAEQLLLHELGLEDWQPPTQTVSQKKFSDFLATGRLDAEYYQPKYDALRKRLTETNNYPSLCLGDVVRISKSIEPGSIEYQDEGMPFLRVSDLSTEGLSPTEICLDPKKHIDALRPKKNTILFSKDGSVGIAYKVEQDMEAITSSAILHLTVTAKGINPDYLTLVLNSIVVQMQAERDAGGSIIQHWKPSEIEAVIIPILSTSTQTRIAEKIRQSFALRAQSNHLLSLAQRAVETAIEHGEDKGMKLLQQELAITKE